MVHTTNVVIRGNRFIAQRYIGHAHRFAALLRADAKLNNLKIMSRAQDFGDCYLYAYLNHGECMVTLTAEYGSIKKKEEKEPDNNITITFVIAVTVPKEKLDHIIYLFLVVNPKWFPPVTILSVQYKNYLMYEVSPVVADSIEGNFGTAELFFMRLAVCNITAVKPEDKDAAAETRYSLVLHRGSVYHYGIKLFDGDSIGTPAGYYVYTDKNSIDYLVLWFITAATTVSSGVDVHKYKLTKEIDGDSKSTTNLTLESKTELTSVDDILGSRLDLIKVSVSGNIPYIRETMYDIDEEKGIIYFKLFVVKIPERGFSPGSAIANIKLDLDGMEYNVDTSENASGQSEYLQKRVYNSSGLYAPSGYSDAKIMKVSDINKYIPIPDAQLDHDFKVARDAEAYSRILAGETFMYYYDERYWETSERNRPRSDTVTMYFPFTVRLGTYEDNPTYNMAVWYADLLNDGAFATYLGKYCSQAITETLGLVDPSSVLTWTATGVAMYSRPFAYHSVQNNGSTYHGRLDEETAEGWGNGVPYGITHHPGGTWDSGGNFTITMESPTILAGDFPANVSVTSTPYSESDHYALDAGVSWVVTAKGSYTNYLTNTAIEEEDCVYKITNNNVFNSSTPVPQYVDDQPQMYHCTDNSYNNGIIVVKFPTQEEISYAAAYSNIKVKNLIRARCTAYTLDVRDNTQIGAMFYSHNSEEDTDNDYPVDYITKDSHYYLDSVDIVTDVEDIVLKYLEKADITDITKENLNIIGITVR